MATRFESIELNNPDLFGVRLNGAVGRSDKENLLELVEKCLANGKVKLVLDLSELSSIGGGGAKILANFQKELQAQGGEAVVAGAGETVRQFLAPKFDGSGKKTKNARITVKQNGVVIHNDVELTAHTPGGVSGKEAPKGPLFLQNHGDAVKFQNIWIQPIED